MPFEERGAATRRVAVIGGGISGMGAAYNLAEDHHVVLPGQAAAIRRAAASLSVST